MGASTQTASRNMVETGKMKSQTPISYSPPNTLWGLSRLLLTLYIKGHSITQEPLNVGRLVMRLDDWVWNEAGENKYNVTAVKVVSSITNRKGGPCDPYNHTVEF